MLRQYSNPRATSLERTIRRAIDRSEFDNLKEQAA